MDIATLMGQILLLSASVVGGLLLGKLLRLDTTLACLMAGVATGWLIPLLSLDTGIRAHNIQPLIFYVILPLLIFEAAWHIKPAQLKRWLAPILLLSTLGLLISCGLLAAIVYYAISHPTGFPWTAALLTGAILAATDPIAVVAALKRLKAPQDLTTLVEGESLFNDASALVLFGAILSFSLGTQSQFGLGDLGQFAITFGGGLLVGALLGLLAALIIRWLALQAANQLLLVLLAFSSFYIAEHLLHLSGIIAVVAAALLCRQLLQQHHQRGLEVVDHTWQWLGLWLNGLIFVLMGLVITFDMFTEQWLAIAIAIPAALCARAVAVFGCGTLSQALPRPVPLDWQYLLIWGGLRGAIAIALVLSLPVSLPYWWTIQSMVFGVVLFSLLIQGATTGPLIKRLKSH